MQKLLLLSVVAGCTGGPTANGTGNLEWAAFLPLEDDAGHRTRMWELYRHAEAVAQQFAQAGQTEWTPIRLVRSEENSARWKESGLIRLQKEGEDPGRLFHHIFGSVFQGSALNQGRDKKWVEAFSDAFRYFMEKQTNAEVPSPWLIEFETLIGIPLARAAGPHSAAKDGYAASLIVGKSERDLSRFEALWVELQERRRTQARDILSDTFDFVPELRVERRTIAKTAVDDSLENLSRVATQARIVPSFKNGKPIGFKIFSIKDDSIYTKMGLKNGDVVMAINGLAMTSPDAALTAYEKLKGATKVSIELMRRGDEMTLAYKVE